MVNRRRRRWLLVALFCVATLLRVALAVRPGLWVDELFSLAMATGHSVEHPAAEAVPALGDYVQHGAAEPAGELARYARHESPPAGAARVVRAVFLSDTSPPLYYLLLNAWTRLFGTSDAAVRLASAACALACFPLLWAVARRIGGVRVASIALVLFTFSPPALYYAAEGRMYSLLWFLGLALAWATFRLARDGLRPLSAAVWILAGAAGLLTHYFFAFVWLACVGWLWFHPRTLTRAHLAAAVAVAVLLVLPWYVQVPESLAHWRVSAGWLDHPLSAVQVLLASPLLAWSFLSGVGVWDGSQPADAVAAACYALLIIAVLRRGFRPLFAERRRLLWLWVLAAVLGPVVFDLLRGTSASLVARYALAGLPGALLLAAVGIGRLAPRLQTGFVVVILLTWTPGLRDLFGGEPRPWEPFPSVADRVARWGTPEDLVIVHSIPTGVTGVARYLPRDVPVASSVPQLGERRPEQLEALLAGRCRVALVKIHDLGVPAAPETWLRRHATLQGRDRLAPFTETLYFRLDRRAGRFWTRCPAVKTPAASGRGTFAPPGRRTDG